MWLFVAGCELGSERILHGLLWSKRVDSAFFSGIRFNISDNLVAFFPEQL
jgi:hypothetical protein